MTARNRRPTAALLAAVATLLMVCAAAAPAARAAPEDRHAGYYYPSPTTETYISRARTLPDMGRETRIAFVTGVTGEQLSKCYPPQYAIFAKGDAAEKMIIVALADGAIASLHQARALLAQLTAISRSTPLFRDVGVQDFFTFFDLIKMLGFRRLTISDGKTYAHQIEIQ